MSKSEDIKKHSHKIWLAGLGAYSMIDETGVDEFEKLVEKGQKFERETKAPKSEGSENRLDELKSRANQTMDRIERAFDLRVSSALQRLGISRKSDLDLLNEKLDKLADALEKATNKLDSNSP